MSIIAMRIAPLLSPWIFIGATLPLFAGLAHPSGPDRLPFRQRVIRLEGHSQTGLLTLSYPKADDETDWTLQGTFFTSSPRPLPLSLYYEY